MKLWWHGDRSIIDLKSHGISWLYRWSSRSHLAEGSFTSTQKKIFSWFIRWINRPKYALKRSGRVYFRKARGHVAKKVNRLAVLPYKSPAKPRVHWSNISPLVTVLVMTKLLLSCREYFSILVGSILHNWGLVAPPNFRIFTPKLPE